MKKLNKLFICIFVIICLCLTYKFIFKRVGGNEIFSKNTIFYELNISNLDNDSSLKYKIGIEKSDEILTILRKGTFKKNIVVSNAVPSYETNNIYYLYGKDLKTNAVYTVKMIDNVNIQIFKDSLIRDDEYQTEEMNFSIDKISLNEFVDIVNTFKN